MALSDHEQTVLRSMEAAWGVADAPSSTVRRPSSRYLVAAIGLLIAGLFSSAVGVALANVLGTGLGVLGFLLIVAAGWSATHLVASLRRRLPTRSSQPAGGSGRPSRH